MALAIWLVSALNWFFSKQRQIHLIFKRSQHLKPAPVPCWEVSEGSRLLLVLCPCALKNLLFLALPMVKGKYKWCSHREKGDVCQCYNPFCLLESLVLLEYFFESRRYLPSSIFVLPWKDMGQLTPFPDGQGMAGKRVKPASRMLLWNAGGSSWLYALPVQTSSGPWACAYIFHGYITQAFEKYSCFLKITPQKLHGKKKKRVDPRNLLGVSGHTWSVRNGQLKYIFQLRGEKNSRKLHKSKLSTAFVTGSALI